MNFNVELPKQQSYFQKNKLDLEDFDFTEMENLLTKHREALHHKLEFNNRLDGNEKILDCGDVSINFTTQDIVTAAEANEVIDSSYKRIYFNSYEQFEGDDRFNEIVRNDWVRSVAIAYENINFSGDGWSINLAELLPGIGIIGIDSSKYNDPKIGESFNQTESRLVISRLETVHDLTVALHEIGHLVASCMVPDESNTQVRESYYLFSSIEAIIKNYSDDSERSSLLAELLKDTSLKQFTRKDAVEVNDIVLYWEVKAWEIAISILKQTNYWEVYGDAIEEFKEDALKSYSYISDSIIELVRKSS